MKIQEINGENKFSSKEIIKKKKKMKKRLFWIKTTLIFILSASAIIFLALSPIFNLKQIEVEGNSHYKKADILKGTSLILGENGFKTIGNSLGNIFRLRYGMEEKNLMSKFFYLKEVKVRFVLPDKIKISLKERKPIFYFNDKGIFLYLDEEATVVEVIPIEKTKSLPEIKGIKFKAFSLGKALEIEDKRQLEAFNKLYMAIKVSDKSDNFKILKNLKYVDLSDLHNVLINLESRISINLGDLNDLSYKIDFMKKDLGFISKEDKGFLDMTLEQPVFKPASD